MFGGPLSRPASSNKYNNGVRASYVRETDEGQIPHLKAGKRERASTAHNKQNKFPKDGFNKINIDNINESAYHINNNPPGLAFNRSQAFKTPTDNIYTINNGQMENNT